MSDSKAAGGPAPMPAAPSGTILPIAPTLARIAGIWVLSDIGFYFVLPVLGLPASYNAGFVGVAIHYFYWIGIAVITFWPLYARWPQHGGWPTFENRLASYVIWSVAFFGCALFATFVLPSLPPVEWTASWEPPELRVATPAYFLPKSVEILFQQLLIVAFVLCLAEHGIGIRRIALYGALGFGLTHLLLAFSGAPLAYVARFTLSAMVFGWVFPYLILRVRNGLAYAYVIHWIYYAATVSLVHFVPLPAR